MKTFDNILLLGRPAAGKSEFIDFLKKTPAEERARNFHIGEFEELDDFVWLWEKFKEDDLWEEAGYPRLYSHRDGNNMGLEPHAGKLFDLMFTKFNHEYEKKYLNNPNFFDKGTLFIEFSRGGEEGFARAFERLSKEMVKRSAILYIDVSFEESWRRNVARYEEKLKHSILAHMATRKVMEHFYKTNDWQKITDNRPQGSIKIQGIDVPFFTMHNEPELKDHGLLSERYKPALDCLMKLWGL